MDPTWDDYDWDPATGLGTFTYRAGFSDEKALVLQQPSSPSHLGWNPGRAAESLTRIRVRGPHQGPLGGRHHY